MKEYIEREAFIEAKRKQYCADCDRRKGMKNGKMRFCYEIGEAPCRACYVDDLLTDVEDAPAADVVEEENILKFYYVRSIDEYWIGRRIDNFYYAEYDPKSRQWVWAHSRYLPWGEHVVSPTSLWKEHTYPSEPEEIPFAEWLQGFIKKHAADVVEVRHGRWIKIEGLSSDYYCSECNQKWWTPFPEEMHYCPHCGAKMDGGVNDAAD